jgi:hypothetical protein
LVIDSAAAEDEPVEGEQIVHGAVHNPDAIDLGDDE